jgi:glyoxylate utilization-related uncharacterized protein
MNESKWDKVEFEWGHFCKLKSQYKIKDEFRQNTQMSYQEKDYWPIDLYQNHEIKISDHLKGEENFKDFILKYWEFKKDVPKIHSSKSQKNSIEYNFIIEGKIQGMIMDNEVVLEAGDFVVIKPGFEINLQGKVLEDTKGITIKIPGIENDEIKKIN